jgi:hypothetical protein
MRFQWVGAKLYLDPLLTALCYLLTRNCHI